MSDRLTLAFVITSAALLAAIGLALRQDESREHREFQRTFQRVVQQRGLALSSDPGAAQVWFPQFERVERCTSCHLGVAQPALRDAPAPFGYHPEVAHAPGDFGRFGCVSCHSGNGAATTVEDAHGRTARSPSPLVDRAHIESRCGRCHDESLVPEAPGLVRGRTLLKEFACFNCHTAGGREVFPPAAPPLEGLSQKVSRRWLVRWLKDPKALDPNARMPNFQLTDREIDVLSDYLLSLPPASAEREAAVRQAALEPPGDAEAGAELFRVSRCISCHTLEGKGHGSAPELSQIGSKATKAWLLAFLEDTHGLNPGTAMPSYQLSGGFRDIVAYMQTELLDFDEPPAPEDRREPAGAERVLEGEQAFVKYGCRTCHAGRDTPREEFGPDLGAVGDSRTASVDFGARRDLPRTIPAWLRAKILEPRSFGPNLRMPSFALSDGDATDMVTALMALSRERVPQPLERSVSGRSSAPPPSGDIGRLFTRYRCLACHLVGEAGTDLSTAPLTFQGSKTNQEWLARYLVLPDTIYPLLTERMPVLGITPLEADQMAAYISTVYVDDAIGARAARHASPTPASVRDGATLFEDKGCRSCHILGDRGGYVGPPLTTAGDRLQSAWIAYWLESPQQWRSEARCPNYGLTQDEIDALTAFLASQRAGPTGP